jgi:hypothetical protein
MRSRTGQESYVSSKVGNGLRGEVCQWLVDTTACFIDV